MSDHRPTSATTVHNNNTIAGNGDATSIIGYYTSIGRRSAGGNNNNNNNGGSSSSAMPSTSANNNNNGNENSSLLLNTALLFIKPHAQTPLLKEFVEQELSAHGLKIVSQGHLRGDAIEEHGTIDRHYAAIGRYAMTSPASETAQLLVLAEGLEGAERRRAFQKLYGVPIEEALSRGRLLNAVEFMAKYGWDGQRVAKSFENAKATSMFKIAPGCYTAMFAENGAIVINGFYLKMREEYVAPASVVSWVVVQWPQHNLSWADFRANVLGATDPSKASSGSIRGKIRANAAALGLSYTPDVGTNCVHGSASPLEALNERLVWAGVGRVDNDIFGKHLISRGLSHQQITAMLGNAKIDGKPIFDIVEDMNTLACANKLVALSAKL